MLLIPGNLQIFLEKQLVTHSSRPPAPPPTVSEPHGPSETAQTALEQGNWGSWAAGRLGVCWSLFLISIAVFRVQL